MLSIGSSAMLAPQNARHPASQSGISGEISKAAQPPTATTETVTDQRQQHLLKHSVQKTRQREEPSAPPSALQIKIEKMLAEQADEISKSSTT